MGKGKVHPSPSLPAAAAAVAGAGGDLTADAVLMRLLPAAVLTAAAPLGAQGKEVLAYLVLASLRAPAPLVRGAAAAAAEEVRAHRPELGCGCFGCYTAYWSRWNGSPEAEREAIHRAIEAFEEHLARKEVEEEVGTGGKARRGRKKRAAAAAAKDKNSKNKGKELAVVDPTPPPLPPPVASAPEEFPKAEDCADDFNPASAEVEPEDAATSTAGEDASSGGEEAEKRRRGWAGGLLNWRPWGLWGSH